jgi:hypothetical protein
LLDNREQMQEVILLRTLSKKLHGCPGGYYGDPEHGGMCSPMLVSRYQKRLSGPLLDRTPAPAAQARSGVFRHLWAQAAQ